MIQNTAAKYLIFGESQFFFLITESCTEYFVIQYISQNTIEQYLRGVSYLERYLRVTIQVLTFFKTHIRPVFQTRII